MSYAIETHKLLKIFHPKSASPVRALNEVDLQVREGEIFALLGPNGAGKTTLLKILSTLILPDSGSAKIFGHDVLKESPEVKKLISFTSGSEAHGFYWRLTGRQNLEFFSALYNLTSLQSKKKIDKLRTMLDLPDLDKRFHYYSAGQKQRLSIAQSFLNPHAKLMFMDEPTRSLDPVSKLHLKQLIRSLTAQHGKTIFLTTHDTREAEQLADHIAILDQGRIVHLSSREQSAEPGFSLENIFYKMTQTSGLDADYVS